MSYTTFGVSREGQISPDRDEEKHQKCGNNDLQRKIKQRFYCREGQGKAWKYFSKVLKITKCIKEMLCFPGPLWSKQLSELSYR